MLLHRFAFEPRIFLGASRCVLVACSGLRKNISAISFNVKKDPLAISLTHKLEVVRLFSLRHAIAQTV